MEVCKQFWTGYPEALSHQGTNDETIRTDFLHLGKVCFKVWFYPLRQFLLSIMQKKSDSE